MKTLATRRSTRRPHTLAGCTVVVATAAAAIVGCGGGGDDAADRAALIGQGRDIFRHDTFGDEALWTDTLRLHEVIASTVSPAAALAVGLKVDADALPAALADAIRGGRVDLTNPATTLALLKLGAVVGVEGSVETVNGADRLTRVGITCALCHSTVDDSLAPGIGKRLDGWPNRDLDPGKIIALSPAVDAAEKARLSAWGPGKFDPRHNVDGLDKPVVIPPAYGLDGIGRITVTGDGVELAYWNRYVAVVEMGGLGSFDEPRLNLHVRHGTEDRVSDKLPALQAYQLSLPAPPPPAGSFDASAAARGKQLFDGPARCAGCHGGPQFTDANQRLHPPSASMAEPETPSYAARSATGQYRSSPLKGLWQHPPYFHDGSAATLADVVRRYDTRLGLGLDAGQVSDLVEYLKSL